uniref:Uncharacterized protein n=1 Tax=Gadus morhua TaxID=8049 RepID=A0A8C5BH81_GADMO
ESTLCNNPTTRVACPLTLRTTALVLDTLLSDGTRTAFEVTVNGQLVFSKLQTGSFPDDTKVREPSCWHRAPHNPCPNLS